ncbi:LysM peptidoglycan-binding domain-containing protein [Streptomyces sp. JHA26]|uniref:LysM peptidoglycan-binding domain-containing protein n=1 Tax=Streptomyces sp. JHA26 TaxID=1917143 RepID=UPI000989CEB1|nr:LysM peptidoglycan-binding domain-containing protein [Streptomyces sp. JHA26]
MSDRALGASRYAGVGTATTTVEDPVDGLRQVRHLRVRRHVPGLTAGRPLALHTVAEGDRLDLVAQRYLGDPLAYWLVADANAALDPDDLTDFRTVGTVLVIPAPGR